MVGNSYGEELESGAGEYSGLGFSFFPFCPVQGAREGRDFRVKLVREGEVSRAAAVRRVGCADWALQVGPGLFGAKNSERIFYERQRYGFNPGVIIVSGDLYSHDRSAKGIC